MQVRFFATFDQGHQQDEKQEGKTHYDLSSTKAGGCCCQKVFHCLIFELINAAGKGQLADHSLAGDQRVPLEARNQQVYKELQLSPKKGVA